MAATNGRAASARSFQREIQPKRNYPRRALRYVHHGGHQSISTAVHIVLPYGMWTCRDGRRVLYNRHYAPIWERWPGEPPQLADRHEWIEDIERKEWFYTDAYPASRCAKTRARCERALQEFGVPRERWLEPLG
jgi:crotonobetainyl-CoA:carnitine CoA-transferase CaiB-like acyl-CoA transferase